MSEPADQTLLDALRSVSERIVGIRKACDDQGWRPIETIYYAMADLHAHGWREFSEVRGLLDAYAAEINDLYVKMAHIEAVLSEPQREQLARLQVMQRRSH